jgi:hypothetical protein
VKEGRERRKGEEVVYREIKSGRIRNEGKESRKGEEGQ